MTHPEPTARRGGVPRRRAARELFRGPGAPGNNGGRLLAGFAKNILRPKVTFGYPKGSPETVCP